MAIGETRNVWEFLLDFRQRTPSVPTDQRTVLWVLPTGGKTRKQVFLKIVQSKTQTVCGYKVLNVFTFENQREVPTQKWDMTEGWPARQFVEKRWLKMYGVALGVLIRIGLLSWDTGRWCKTLSGLTLKFCLLRTYCMEGDGATVCALHSVITSSRLCRTTVSWDDSSPRPCVTIRTSNYLSAPKHVLYTCLHSRDRDPEVAFPPFGAWARAVVRVHEWWHEERSKPITSSEMQLQRINALMIGFGGRPRVKLFPQTNLYSVSSKWGVQGVLEACARSIRAWHLQVRTAPLSGCVCISQKVTQPGQTLRLIQIFPLLMCSCHSVTLSVPTWTQPSLLHEGTVRGWYQKSFLVMFSATRHSNWLFFVCQSPGTIADQWEWEDLDQTTKTSDIGRKEFWDKPRTRWCQKRIDNFGKTHPVSRHQNTEICVKPVHFEWCLLLSKSYRMHAQQDQIGPETATAGSSRENAGKIWSNSKISVQGVCCTSNGSPNPKRGEIFVVFHRCFSHISHSQSQLTTNQHYLFAIAVLCGDFVRAKLSSPRVTRWSPTHLCTRNACQLTCFPLRTDWLQVPVSPVMTRHAVTLKQTGGESSCTTRCCPWTRSVLFGNTLGSRTDILWMSENIALSLWTFAERNKNVFVLRELLAFLSNLHTVVNFS